MKQLGDLENESLNSDLDFDLRTIEKEEISIALINNGTGIPGVLVKLWNANPSDGGEVILKGITDLNGEFRTTYNLPVAFDQFIVETGYMGLPDMIQVSREQLISEGIQIRSDRSEFEFNEIDDGNYPALENPFNGRTNTVFTPLGSYGSDGVPDYLIGQDALSNELLSFINASLPESQPVPTYHPRYIDQSAQTNIEVVDEADVWMTFVHEGAGYRNILGFYTYDTDNPPSTTDEISEIKVAFPNVSFSGSGGGLETGDKIYLGRFQAGTTIGFCLFANGWNGSITGGYHQVYSDSHLNPESTPDKQHHTVLLWDSENELFLVGFEDLRRDSGSDEDFNDAIFYITANPITSLSTENVNPVDQPQDADGDGVNDVYDEYPDDPDLAYNYLYPGENSYGTFAFEDQWPRTGDYDFNDLVVDYQYNQLANATNRLTRLNAKFVIKAVGAGYQNGFGIQLDCNPEKIRTISGNDIGGDLFSFNSNGTESGQSKAVIAISDNVHQGFQGLGFINTSPSLSYQLPDTINILVDLIDPVAFDDVGIAPYNPFLVINQVRGREVHLPSYEPTDLVDPTYFGQENDRSNPSLGVYYKTGIGLPWGMNLPVSFEYPMEKIEIRECFLHFDAWARSGGFTFMDWYEDKAGFRNTDKLYNQQ